MAPSQNQDTPFLQARRALILDHCFFGSLVMHLKEVEDAKAGHGIWVDGRSIGYNAESLAAMDLGQRAGLLAKGVMQCALGHHVRRDSRDQKLWNRASDLVVNPEIIDSGLPLPDGAQVDRQYQGKSVEQVYTLLELERQKQQPQSGGNEDGEGDGEKGPQGKSGSAQGNGPQTGEVRDLPGDAAEQPANDAEKNKDESEWKINMQQALQNALSRGDLPGNFKAMIERELAPRVSWKDELRRYMMQFARDDMSWSRPNRRFIGQGIYLPAVHSERMGTMVVVNDTSGSTGFAQKKFLAEMQAIIEDLAPERIIYVQQDSVIQKVTEIEPGDELDSTIHGMGGTDFRPVFKWIEEEGIAPACMVFLTDLDGDFPAAEPDFPVLWAVAGSTDHAPFGDIIRLDDIF